MSLRCPVCGASIDFISPDGSAVCPECNTFIDPPGQTIDEIVHAPVAHAHSAWKSKPPLSPVQGTYRFMLFALCLGAFGALLFLGGALAGDGTPFGLAIFSVSFIVFVAALCALGAMLVEPGIIEDQLRVGLTRLRAVLVFLPLALAAGFIAYKTYSP